MPPFEVIVPVRNEAFKLTQTAPALKVAVQGLPAKIIYVLNATTDQSAAVIEAAFGGQAEIIHLKQAGKTAALRAGDDAASHGLRVYLDADVLVEPASFPTLLAPLIDGSADLVAPRMIAEMDGGKGFAQGVSRVWSDQLMRRQDAFMNFMAFNAAGIERRGEWIDVIADDDWARDRIDPARRLIVEEVGARITPPTTLRGWLTVRARWIRGQRELVRLGMVRPHCSTPRPRGSFLDLAAYYAIRLGAEPLALYHHWTNVSWGRDNSTRGQ